MVDIVRRKDARIKAPDVSSSQLALASGLEKIGNQLLQGGKKLEKQGIKERKQAETSYIQDVADNLRTEQKRLADQQKTFDAADKLVAADMSGRLRNDLLRWNMEQREKNPATIGTPEHERAMRDQYARLSKQYGAGLGEVGTAAFNEKTQATVNDFIQNDIKWSYQKKIKQAEQAARDAAKAAEQTAAAYGANGDVDGFKQAHSENRQVLEEYANDVAPAGANQALAELDKNALLQFYNNLAQTNPVMAKALLDSMENFKETVPDEMLQNANESAKNAQTAALKDEIIMLNAAIAGTKDKKEKRKLEKHKSNLEKQIKEIEKKDFTEESLSTIYDDVRKSVYPQIQKQYELNVLAAKQAKEKAVADMYKMALSPDTRVSSDARMALRTQQPSDTDSEMRKTYKEYIKADQSVIKNTEPTLQGTLEALGLINNLFQPTSDPDIKQVEKALKTSTEIHNSPVTQEQYEQGNNIIYNAVSDPDYKAQTQHTMALAKANILDHYAELFSPDVPETDKEFQKPMDTTPVASGIMRDFKTKKIADFNYAAASEKNKAKYNLVKDTYVGVLNDMAIGKFEDANRKIFELPYKVAAINYESKLSPDLLIKFMEQDRTGGKSVEFMYNGYSFEYLGIDPTGTIKAKRRL